MQPTIEKKRAEVQWVNFECFRDANGCRRKVGSANVEYRELEVSVNISVEIQTAKQPLGVLPTSLTEQTVSVSMREEWIATFFSGQRKKACFALHIQSDGRQVCEPIEIGRRAGESIELLQTGLECSPQNAAARLLTLSAPHLRGTCSCS